MADAEDFTVQASGEVSPPKPATLEILRERAENGGKDDKAAYEAARKAYDELGGAEYYEQDQEK
jgi:hypothetical protein